MIFARVKDRQPLVFQCSSASRKFLNTIRNNASVAIGRFQCSSASRKFLNSTNPHTSSNSPPSFSALQRAENSSIHREEYESRKAKKVSVLFSEPKIPQSICCKTELERRRVSVLFSEPKIPQCCGWTLDNTSDAAVSVLFSEPKIPQ